MGGTWVLQDLSSHHNRQSLTKEMTARRITATPRGRKGGLGDGALDEKRMRLGGSNKRQPWKTSRFQGGRVRGRRRHQVWIKKRNRYTRGDFAKHQVVLK